MFTSLHRPDGSFLPFAVTEAETDAARLDPDRVVLGPADTSVRQRLGGVDGA